MKCIVVGRPMADLEALVRRELMDRTSAVVLAYESSPAYRMPKPVILVCRAVDLLTAQTSRGALSFEVSFNVMASRELIVPTREVERFDSPPTPLGFSTRETVLVHSGIPY